MVYTAADTPIDPPLLGIDILTKVFTSQEYKLGTLVKTASGNQFRFCKATGTRAKNDLCSIDSLYNLGAAVTHAGMGSGANGTKLGALQSGALASGQYGFVQTAGLITVNIAGAVAQSAKAYTSATPGALDDASASQTLIEHATWNAAAASGTGVLFADKEITANMTA